MAQFILKDSKGKEQTFDHETIYVRDTNGELVQFTQGEGDIPAVVQPLEVTENGTYTAPDGVDGYSPVTVNVAGSGGETIEPIKAYGKIRPTSETDCTITHNLGVVPDCFMMSASGVANGTLSFAIGNRSAVKTCYYQQSFAFVNASGVSSTLSVGSGIENTNAADLGFFYSADESTIKVGGTAVKLDTSKEYNWHAVRAIPYSTDAVLESLEVTENGNYYPPNGVDGYKQVTVSVMGEAAEQRIEYTYDDAGNIVGSTPYGFVELPRYALAGVTTLKWVDLSKCPDLKKISEYSFHGCTALESISIPDGVETIDSYAFNGCSSLKSIIIPYGVKSIRHHAFQNCKAITSIAFPEGITSWGNSICMGCSALTSMTLPSDMTSIPSQIAQSTALKSINIPSGVTSIGGNAFYGCNELSSVTIPNSVKSIGDYAFKNCSVLNEVTFNDTSGWYVTLTSGATSGTNVSVSSKTTAANYLKNTYASYYWYDKT